MVTSPFAMSILESGDPSNSENRCDEREYQKEDCKLDEISPELQRHRLNCYSSIQNSVRISHILLLSLEYFIPRLIHPQPVFD